MKTARKRLRSQNKFPPVKKTPSPPTRTPPQTCENEVANGKAIQGHDSRRREHGRVPREAGSSQAVAAEGPPSQFAEALAQTAASAGGAGAAFTLRGKTEVAEGKTGWMVSGGISGWMDGQIIEGGIE